MIKIFRNLSNRGAALVEYGMLVGMIAVLAIGAVLALGEQVGATFDTGTAALASANAEAGGEAVAEDGETDGSTGGGGGGSTSMHF